MGKTIAVSGGKGKKKWIYHKLLKSKHIFQAVNSPVGACQRSGERAGDLSNGRAGERVDK